MYFLWVFHSQMFQYNKLSPCQAVLSMCIYMYIHSCVYTFVFYYKINHSLFFLMGATFCLIPFLLYIPNSPIFFLIAYLPESSSAHRKISCASVSLFIQLPAQLFPLESQFSNINTRLDLKVQRCLKQGQTLKNTEEKYFYFFLFLNKKVWLCFIFHVHLPLQNSSSQQHFAEFIIRSFATSAQLCHTKALSEAV